MISASSLNTTSNPHGHSLSSKSSQMPLALENGRLRVDSQKFLVPSLPVSSRISNGSSGDMSGKRRERSIINGTALPPDNNLHLSSHTHHTNHHHSLGLHSGNNGLRRSSSSVSSAYNHQNHNGTNVSINTSNGQLHLSPHSPHYPSAHLSTSPRKDAHSPMYAGEVSNPGNYPGRSSMPIPCSSPSPASSASPKSLNQSHSPNTSGSSPSSRNYSSPQLPPGPVLPSGVNVSNSIPDLNSLSSSTNRLYSGGFHGLGTHPGGSPSPHLSPAFYAAAAAAAAHSIPYPLFGAHPYSHAAGTYLDSFHSNLLVPPNLRTSSTSSAPSQSSRSHSSCLPQHQQHHPMTQTTSTTSLHTKLIESVSASNERHGHNSHHHQLHHQHHQHQQPSPHVHSAISHGHVVNTSNSHSHNNQANYSRYLANGMSGLSKGGPLGIGMGIGATVPNLPPPALPAPHKVSFSESCNKSYVNGSSSTSCSSSLSSAKMWIDSATAPSLLLNSSRADRNMTPTESNGSEKETDANKDANKVPLGKETKKCFSLKHRILTRSPDDLTVTISPKVSKSISFAEFNGSHSHNNSSSSLSNGRSHHHSQRSTTNSHSQINGHHQHHHQEHAHYPATVTGSVTGVLVDSNNAKNGNTNNSNSNTGKHSGTNSNINPFLPPSPKKRSAPWNSAVPATKIDLPPPQPLTTHHHPSTTTGNSGESKYLSQNQKPSNQSNPSSPYLSTAAQQQQQQQHSAPNSPAKYNVDRSNTGGSTTTNISAKHHNGAKENGKSRAVSIGKERNSSSSSSNSDSSTAGSAVPVEAMPVLTAFKRGSLIQLANGELRPVEDLQTEDFLQAAAISAEATKIIHCTILSILIEPDSPICKVTLSMGSQKQQVIMEATPEQPFFILGRGWSSSSPLTTQKLLQLPCTPLAVGDVCITLSRIQSKPKTSQFPPKSPGVKTKGAANGGTVKARNGSATANSNTAKGSRLSNSSNNSSATATTTNKLSRKAATNNVSNGKSSSMPVTMSNGGNLSAMLPPPSTSMTAPKSSMNNSLPVDAADENERPPSPKKRRWSAPVDNLTADGEVDKDNLAKKENSVVRIKA